MSTDTKDPTQELMELIFKEELVKSSSPAIEQVREKLLSENQGYKDTIEILNNHKMQNEEIYNEVRIGADRLAEIVTDIKAGVDNQYVNYAVEIVQLNTIDSIL